MTKDKVTKDKVTQDKVTKDMAEGAKPPTPTGQRGVTPLEIQQKEFAVARFGGYKMRDVDEFLDVLTESVGAVLSENERLRRQSGDAPVVGAPDLDDVARQADEIIQRARDEAGRIVAEANERAASIAGSLAAGQGGGGADAVQAFLAQERVFLQSLASLVQGHVDSVKGMARTASERKAAATAPQPETSDPGPAPLDEAREADAATAPAAEEDVRAPRGDVTQVVPEADAPIRADEPQRTGAKVTTAKPAGGEDGEESLRELFWGEES